MSANSSMATLSSGATRTNGPTDEEIAARGLSGEPGPTLQDVEKDAGLSGVGEEKASSGGTSKEEAHERDSDGVMLENGVPIVRLTGPDDPVSPLNMAKGRRWLIVILITSCSFCITCCSSMIPFTYPQVEAEFHISQEVATLGLSLYVLGMGLFPLLVGPLSEWYGRLPVYQIGFTLFFIFQFMCAFANGPATLIIGRFLAGSSGSAFLSVAGGSVADLFKPAEVGAPMAFYTAGPFLAPALGPVISGFIVQYTTWRWTWRVLIIWAGIELLLLVLLVPETYLPAVLKKKAKKLRKAGRADVKAPIELDTRSIAAVIGTSCVKPFELLALEPMALVLCTWTAILLGILYMAFTAWGIVYRAYGFETWQVGLTYIPLGLGIALGGASHPFWAGYYRKKAKQLQRRPPPEEHLRKGLYGAVICPIALFWFAFTTYTSVHWIVSLIATVPFGFGIMLSFNAVFAFLVDAYRPYAASAMAANSAMRSSFAAAFPLFTTQMFAALGTQYALMLCAFLCLAITPFPFLFFKRGHLYRKGSKFANREE
ncbi:hypothetical protein JCM10207_005020 [Rhodosporidiobolus poonsookiae]